MNKKFSNLKLILSLSIGIIGIIILSFNFSCLCQYISPVAEKICHNLSKNLPLHLIMIVDFVGHFGFSIVFFLSLICIFLGINSLKTPSKNLAVFAIVLNIINLIISVFIGWLVYGLSTGAM